MKKAEYKIKEDFQKKVAIKKKKKVAIERTLK